VKLLRVLEERKVQRLGSVREIALDIRIIAATNRDLKDLVTRKGFREDLFYRLNVIQIGLPPLKDRAGDILLLAEKFIGKYARKIGKEVTGVDQAAADLLANYSWPGNVRELENIIERAMVLTRSNRITRSDLTGLSVKEMVTGVAGGILPLLDVEKRHIQVCLDQLNWNLGLCAEKLGIHRNTLRSKIKEYSLSKNPK